MSKTPFMLASLAALALAMPAAAGPKSRTRTYEGPRTSAVQTTTVDREAGTATRNRAVTNRATGASASSSAVAQRTDTGAIIAAEQTGPHGRTRSLEGERVRTEGGANFTGTATGAGGQTYGLAASRSRDGRGNSSASQSITNNAGQTLASRSRVTTRGNGQVNTSISRTGPRRR
ncbi:MAG: hypothetical protein ACKO01_13675 [Erythrobacter sp.]